MLARPFMHDVINVLDKIHNCDRQLVVGIFGNRPSIAPAPV